MYIWIVEQGQLVLYKRNGECKGCGACCREYFISFETGHCSKEEVVAKGEDFLSWEGWSYIEDGDFCRWMKATVLGIRHREKQCISLDGNRCKLWRDDAWPFVCRYWPIHPQNLERFPDCGFAFEKTEEKKEL